MTRLATSWTGVQRAQSEMAVQAVGWVISSVVKLLGTPS